MLIAQCSAPRDRAIHLRARRVDVVVLRVCEECRLLGLESALALADQRCVLGYVLLHLVPIDFFMASRRLSTIAAHFLHTQRAVFVAVRTRFAGTALADVATMSVFLAPRQGPLPPVAA